MKILILGAGGREHAIARAVLRNSQVETVYVAPGNAGTAIEKGCENLAITDYDKLADFAEKEKIALTVPGPEVALVDGVVDLFKSRKLPIFGADKAGALLEGSKTYSKDFMKKWGVKTAEYQNFSDIDEAMAYLDVAPFPLVVKADGLAAGKGVLICPEKKDAVDALNSIMAEGAFGKAGGSVVIEEFLEGKEASILALYDGNVIIPFVSAKDHKKIGEGETGLNTGGMGVVAPNPYVTPEVNELFIKDILEPTLKGLKGDNLLFAGTIFFGLMMTEKGVYSLEYNMRFGDPEAQAVFPLLKDLPGNDLLTLLMECEKGKGASLDPQWEDKASCCVVGVSGGYPGTYPKGKAITGLGDVSGEVYIAGAEMVDGVPVTSGGRVLCVVAKGDDMDEARKKAYSDIKKVQFDGMHYRTDIGE